MGGVDKKTILLVEDEAIIALAQKKSLERYGYRVIRADSGEAALGKLEEPTAVDLILMDINLGGGMDGTEAAERILRAHDIPVVFVSSHVEPEIVRKTELISSYGYVVKNSGITILDASIKMAFRLHEAHRKMRESELKHSVMVSNISDVIGVLSAEGRISYLSPSVEKNFGWRPDEHPGEIWGIVHPEDRERVREILFALTLGSSSERTIEFRTLRRDGSYSHAELRAINLLADPAIAGILVNYHDISERTRESQELAMQKSLLRDIIESASEAIFAKDLEGRYQIINEAGAAMIGFRPGDMIGRSDRELLPEETAEDFLKLDKLVASSGQRRERETAVVIRGRQLVYVVHESPWMDSSGRTIGVIGVAMDITERKRTEDNLKEQKTLLDSIIESLSQPIFAKNAAGRYVALNRAGARLLGQPPSKLIGRTASEILPREISRVIDAADEEVMRTGQPKDLESAVELTGLASMYGVSKSPWKDEAGTTIGVVDVSYDITERKRAEEGLSTQRNLLKSILESSSEAIFAKDREGTYLVINEVGAKILGRSASDVISHNDGELFPSAQTLAFKRDDDYVMANDKVIERETVFERDGRSTFYLARKSPWKDESGRIIGVIGVSSNRTEGRRLGLDLDRASERADRSQRKFNILADSLPINISYINAETLEYEYVNRCFQETMSMPLGKILGCSVASVLGPASYEFARSYLEEARTGKSLFYENYFNLSTGRRWLRVNYCPIPGRGGKIESILVVSFDLTDHKKTEEENRLLLGEKDLLLKEVHHRIKNNMATVMGLLSLQASTLRDPEPIKALEDAGSRIQSMMILYDTIYQSAGTGSGPISVKDYLERLVDDIVENFPNRSLVRVEKRMEDFPLDLRMLQPLGIIVNELITNIMKYAFGGREGGTISISASLSEGSVVLKVDDDGVGMPDSIDFEHSPGFGLTLVKELVLQLEGSIRIERGPGTRLVLQFKA
jgi:PAS domain S-box-containing protein